MGITQTVVITMISEIIPEIHYRWKIKPVEEACVLEENLLSAQGGTGVGVSAVGALEPVCGGGAAGQASRQPGVGSPLPAGYWSCS